LVLVVADFRAEVSGVLSNPAPMQQYSGISMRTTQRCIFLAELLRLKILPTGHIYEHSCGRCGNLLRRRMTLVHNGLR